MDKKSPDAFRTIREVADWLGVPTHVLRFWESKFKQVSPVKGAGGRRYYRREDILLLGGIKELLHEQGMTIRGAQKLIDEHGISAATDLSPEPDFETSPSPRNRRRVRRHSPPETVEQHTGDAGGIYALDRLSSGPTDDAEAPMAENVPHASEKEDDLDTNVVPFGGVSPELQAPPEPISFAEAISESQPTQPDMEPPTPEPALDIAAQEDPTANAPLTPPIPTIHPAEAARALIARHKASGASLDPAAQARVRVLRQRLRGLVARLSAEQDL